MIKDLLKQIDGKLSGFIRGQLTVAFFLGLYLCRRANRGRIELWFPYRHHCRFLVYYPDGWFYARFDC